MSISFKENDVLIAKPSNPNVTQAKNIISEDSKIWKENRMDYYYNLWTLHEDLIIREK